MERKPMTRQRSEWADTGEVTYTELPDMNLYRWSCRIDAPETFGDALDVDPEVDGSFWATRVFAIGVGQTKPEALADAERDLKVVLGRLAKTWA